MGVVQRRKGSHIMLQDRKQSSWKRQETECPLKLPEEMQPCQHLDFRLDFQTVRESTGCCLSQIEGLW